MLGRKNQNTILLAMSILSVVLFVIPLNKLDVVGDGGLSVKILYHIFSGLMVMSLGFNIVVGIINLAKDKYQSVVAMHILTMIAMLCVMSVLVCTSISSSVSITVYYLIVVLSVYASANFIQIVKIIAGKKKIKQHMLEVFEKENK